MNKEGLPSRNFPMCDSKFSHQTITSGATQYLSLKTPYKEGPPVLSSGNQEPGL